MPSPWQQRLDNVDSMLTDCNQVLLPTLWGGIREDPMEKKDFHSHLVEMSTHLMALHRVEGGHIESSKEVSFSTFQGGISGSLVGSEILL